VGPAVVVLRCDGHEESVNQHLRFGTDGIRGLANEQLTPEGVLALGRAFATICGSGPVLIGRDTRLSGTMLEQALAAGLATQGVDVLLCGVTSTPGLAWLSVDQQVPAAMISASHNHFADNGIKFFAAGGKKLDDDAERTVESVLHGLGRGTEVPRADSADVGTISLHPDPLGGYEASLVNAIEGRSLEGMRVVLDAANGSASYIAPDVFSRLGADVVTLHAEPDGCNINANCGSTYPQELAQAVVDTGSDLGLAFDGDADRMLAVSATGDLLDGDQLMALFAIDLKAHGRLFEDTVVVTVMTNMGFKLGMQAAGITVSETQVGDRAVRSRLTEGGFSLGGEQSGHLIFTDHAVTGDGVLAGVLLCDLILRTKSSVSQLADDAMTKLPQVLINVRVRHRPDDVASDLQGSIEAAQAELGTGGRILVRSSGTEPLVRVMVEAQSPEQAQSVAERVAEVTREKLG
jgi:phosphoglucosamine mutase